MKNKKNIIIVVVLIVIILLAIIYKQTKDYVQIPKNPKEIKLGDTFVVERNKTVNVEDLKIKLVSASDSRCQEGFQCIWQGELSYDIEVNGERITLGSVKNPNTVYKYYNISLAGDNDSTKYVKLTILGIEE